MSNDLDKIDLLFTEEDPLDIPRMVDASKPFIIVSSGDKSLHLTQLGRLLPDLQKVTLVLLVRKLLIIRQLITVENLSAAEIRRPLQPINKSRVEELLHQLQEEQIIEECGNSYYLVNAQVERVLEPLEQFRDDHAGVTFPWPKDIFAVRSGSNHTN